MVYPVDLQAPTIPGGLCFDGFRQISRETSRAIPQFQQRSAANSLTPDLTIRSPSQDHVWVAKYVLQFEVRSESGLSIGTKPSSLSVSKAREAAPIFALLAFPAQQCRLARTPKNMVKLSQTTLHCAISLDAENIKSAFASCFRPLILRSLHST